VWKTEIQAFVYPLTQCTQVLTLQMQVNEFMLKHCAVKIVRYYHPEKDN